ncbi:D-alanyl-D-alanine carboxypeptidase family protein, partial [Vibrio parahaemolyticus V-223/04]
VFTLKRNSLTTASPNTTATVYFGIRA